jgi:hypothetical protein
MSLGAGRVDEAHARVLCGEPPSADAAAELQDLAENVGALRGDDAPSRALLAAIARRMSVTAVVVVRVDAGHPVARVFLADTGVFDAAAYAPDDTAARSWVGTVRSLARVLGTQATTAPLRPPALATHDGPRIENSPPSRRHFYESGWFWGAIGAAAFAGGAIYFAARDSGSPTIHLEMQVPR